MNEIAWTGRQAWATLCTRGGLEPEGRDESVASSLRESLGLSPIAPLGEALDAQSISSDSFLRAFLVAVRPYTEMWVDLLAMFERAAATEGSDELEIAFDFGAGSPPLRFDLQHFRSAITMFRRLPARFDFSSVNGAHFGAITTVFYGLNRDEYGKVPTGNVQADEFDMACRGQPWPLQLPDLKSTGHGRFDGLVSEVGDLCQVFLEGLREFSSSYSDINEIPADPGSSTADGIKLQVLRYVESDYWLPMVVSTMVAALNRNVSLDWENAALALDGALLPFRNTDPDRTSLRMWTEDLLRLPVWNARHELFSNWVCTQVIDALSDQHPRVFSSKGKLVFSFKGTHLATFDSFEPRLHLWTELRSALASPVGKGRSSAIQPDITLVRDPVSAIEEAPIAIECKQYAKANNRNFANALTDYANGRSKSLVVLASYGLTDDAVVRKRIPPELHDRIEILSELRPESSSAQMLRTVLRSWLEIQETARWSEDSLPLPFSAPGWITLAWGATPLDLDLAIVIDSSDGIGARVDFHEMGSTDSFPWVALDADQQNGFGLETLSIARLLEAQYRVEVMRYSQDSSLAESGATVMVHSDASGTVAFECPPDIDGDVWRPCVIQDGTLRALP